MDSLGRKFFDVSERTRDRDFKQFMNSIPTERVGGGQAKNNSDLPVKMDSAIESMKTVTKLLLAIASLVVAIKVIMKLLDEMESMRTEEEEGAEGDVFDKIFGSEFQNKFKNSALNQGEYKKRQEERRQRTIRDLSETTPLDEINSQIKSPGEDLIGVLRDIASGEDGCLKRLSKCPFATEIFRIVFEGYTFREIMGDESIGTRTRAAGYILSAFR
jgi:hypothetical protein